MRMEGIKVQEDASQAASRAASNAAFANSQMLFQSMQPRQPPSINCTSTTMGNIVILCPRKNPKIQESYKNKAIRRTGAKGQLKNARRNKKRLGFNLPPPSLCFFGFSNGLSICLTKYISSIISDEAVAICQFHSVF